MSAPIVDGFVMWRCKCGHVSFRHHEHCDRCGEERPAPPPEAEPSDISRPDSATGAIGLYEWWTDSGVADWIKEAHPDVWSIYAQYMDSLEAQMQRADEP